MRLPPERLTANAARRITLAASGFRDPRPAGVPGARHVARALDRLGMVQIDSVNVLARAHYLPLFSRLGPYDPALLDRAAYGPRRTLFEYWGHAASLIRLDLQPLLRWRMEEARAGIGIYGGLARFAAERRPFIDAVLREVAERGPTTAGELAEGGASRKGWWEWSDGKRALEWLFWAGYVTTASRRSFARLYDLTQRVLPPDILARPTPSTFEAQRELVQVAARALGVATEADLGDYFRLPRAASKAVVASLAEDGGLRPVTVEGWTAPAFLAPEVTAVPRRIEARTVLSPFDPLLWERSRAERVLGLRYRIEIYTPAAKREHGYYVLPFLLGDRIAARVDLKADRAASRLLVQSVHVEPGMDERLVAESLDAEFTDIARWLSLESVQRPTQTVRSPGTGPALAF